MAAIPPVLVAVGFFVAVVTALLFMAYIAWRGSQPSTFFLEAVRSTYELRLPEDKIEAYYNLKEQLREQYAPDTLIASEAPEETTDGSAAQEGQEDGVANAQPPWVFKVPPEEYRKLREALMRRLVACIDKLDQVHNDKPGNWKLWRAKLVSEQYWISLCEAERLVSEEINTCIAEAQEIRPGWRDHIFQQAWHEWTQQKQDEVEKKMQKKAIEQELKRKEVEERKKEEDKQRQERLAEKAMEKLLREEEKAAASTKTKAKAGAAKQSANTKVKGKKN